MLYLSDTCFVGTRSEYIHYAALRFAFVCDASLSSPRVCLCIDLVRKPHFTFACFANSVQFHLLHKITPRSFPSLPARVADVLRTLFGVLRDSLKLMSATVSVGACVTQLWFSLYLLRKREDILKCVCKTLLWFYSDCVLQIYHQRRI